MPAHLDFVKLYNEIREGNEMRYVITVELKDQGDANFIYDELQILLSDLDVYNVLSMVETEEAKYAASRDMEQTTSTPKLAEAP